jgi:hypothetical protein
MQEGWDPIMQMHINDGCFLPMYRIFEKASTDCDLANFLRERAVQYRDDVEPTFEREIIAEVSVEYIQVGAAQIPKYRPLFDEYPDWHLSSGVGFHSWSIRTSQI